jgi:Domain of unknown function (DUF4333)
VVRLATTLTVLAVLTVLVVGWFNSADPLPAERVAAGVADAFEAELDFRPDVSCPHDLEAEVGAETRCTAAMDGVTYGATVTVTAVDDDGAEFDVQVDRG